MFSSKLLFIITISLFDIEAKIITVPRDVAGVEGSSISLECSTDTDYKLRWFRWTNHTPDSKERVFSGRKVMNDTIYSVNTTKKGQFDLIINSFSTELTGTYECEEQETNSSRTAEVSILNDVHVWEFWDVKNSSTIDNMSYSERIPAAYFSILAGLLVVIVLIVVVFSVYTYSLKQKRLRMEELVRDLTIPSYIVPMPPRYETTAASTEYSDLYQLPNDQPVSDHETNETSGFAKKLHASGQVIYNKNGGREIAGIPPRDAVQPIYENVR